MLIGQLQSNLKNLYSTSRWVLRLVYQLSPRYLLAVLISQLFISTLPFLRNRLFSNVIDQILNSINYADNSWQPAFLIFIATTILISLVFFFQRFLNQSLSSILQSRLRIAYIDKISSLDYQHFENKETANLISKTNDNYQWRTQQVINELNNLLSNLISLITIGIIIIPQYWYLALVLLISQIPNIRLQYLLVKKDWEHWNLKSENMRQSWELGWQLNNKNNLAEIKINNSKEYLFSKFSQILTSFTQGNLKIQRDALGGQFGAIIISNLVIAFCLFVIIRDIQLGILTIGLFTFYFETIRQINDIFSGLVSSFISISQQNLYISDFKKVMELKPIISSGNYHPSVTKPPLIEFKNITFTYPNTKQPIFKNFNLTINPGEEIAIVGQNGAGKSTIIKLLLRYYDHQSGEIMVNGRNIKNYRLSDWYRYLSFLSQEFNIYQNLSLKENVFLGRPQQQSNSKIIKSLKKADAYTFVKKYKNGLNTLMSQRYGGEEPSWGQWQKIAIARVFYRDTPIMILDEPTASIDAVSEAKIFENIYQQSHGKTLIIVSHRFSTVRNAQRIIVIDKGKIVENGSHQELLKLNGLYAHSFNLQAKGYSSDNI